MLKNGRRKYCNLISTAFEHLFFPPSHFLRVCRVDYYRFHLRPILFFNSFFATRRKEERGGKSRSADGIVGDRFPASALTVRGHQLVRESRASRAFTVPRRIFRPDYLWLRLFRTAFGARFIECLACAGHANSEPNVYSMRVSLLLRALLRRAKARVANSSPPLQFRSNYSVRGTEAPTTFARSLSLSLSRAREFFLLLFPSFLF